MFLDILKKFQNEIPLNVIISMKLSLVTLYIENPFALEKCQLGRPCHKCHDVVLGKSIIPKEK